MLALVLPLPSLLNFSFLYLLLLRFLLFFLPPFLVLFPLLFIFYLLCLKLTLLRGKSFHPAFSIGKLNEQDSYSLIPVTREMWPKTGPRTAGMETHLIFPSAELTSEPFQSLKSDKTPKPQQW